MKRSLITRQSPPSESIILGMVEFKSIAIGIKSLDEMIKKAPIKVLDARTISPGNYLTLFTGDLSSVEEAVHKGVEISAGQCIDYFILPNLHPQIIPAMLNITEIDQLSATGIIETNTVASAIVSADEACKATDIQLIELRLANGLGGKSFYVFLGELYAVEFSMEKALASLALKGNLMHSAVIPSPHEDLRDFL